MTLTAPQPINDAHHVAPFDSGVPALDDWLNRIPSVSHAG
jgi:hypothetical protein